MQAEQQLAALAEAMGTLKQAAQRPYRLGEDLPAVRCNTARILAGTKMLELTISDVAASRPENTA